MKKLILSSGQKAEISRCDFPRIKGWRLCPFKARNATYVVAWKWDSKTKKQTKIFLHRFLMNAQPSQMVCHLNRNGLDCKRRNMRFGNHHLNGCSFRTKRRGAASPYRGVNAYTGRGKKWSVQFIDSGTLVYIGRFSTQLEAAKAYDKEAKKRFGRFAHLNFP